MVFMKLRISITLLSTVVFGMTGCSTMKTAYNGNERSRLANPAKVASANRSEQLAPVAEGPVTPMTHSANPGGTGSGAMTGTSNPEAWGGALSSR